MNVLRADYCMGCKRGGRGNQRRRHEQRDIDIAATPGQRVHSAHFGELRAQPVHLPVARDQLASLRHSLAFPLLHHWVAQIARAR